MVISSPVHECDRWGHAANREQSNCNTVHMGGCQLDLFVWDLRVASWPRRWAATFRAVVVDKPEPAGAKMSLCWPGSVAFVQRVHQVLSCR